jgi:hypothetical protein
MDTPATAGTRYQQQVHASNSRDTIATTGTRQQQQETPTATYSKRQQQQIFTKET